MNFQKFFYAGISALILGLITACAPTNFEASASSATTDSPTDDEASLSIAMPSPLPSAVPVTSNAELSCAARKVRFGWGVVGIGDCEIELPEATPERNIWYTTPITNAHLGGLAARCENGNWHIDAGTAKCVSRTPSNGCFASGTRCDGSGPAFFPYPHCWTCCNPSDVNGPACR